MVNVYCYLFNDDVMSILGYVFNYYWAPGFCIPFFFYMGKNNFIRERLVHVQRTQRSSSLQDPHPGGGGGGEADIKWKVGK